VSAARLPSTLLPVEFKFEINSHSNLKFVPQVKAEISKFKVGAPARVGLVAPNDVTIPSGGTGMDPSQTSFFQALAIATKINKGERRNVALRRCNVPPDSNGCSGYLSKL
jgi:hypothetical protein